MPPSSALASALIGRRDYIQPSIQSLTLRTARFGLAGGNRPRALAASRSVYWKPRPSIQRKDPFGTLARLPVNLEHCFSDSPLLHYARSLNSSFARDSWLAVLLAAQGVAICHHQVDVGDQVE